MSVPLLLLFLLHDVFAGVFWNAILLFLSTVLYFGRGLWVRRSFTFPFSHQYSSCSLEMDFRLSRQPLFLFPSFTSFSFFFRVSPSPRHHLSFAFSFLPSQSCFCSRTGVLSTSLKLSTFFAFWSSTPFRFLLKIVSIFPVRLLLATSTPHFRLRPWLFLFQFQLLIHHSLTTIPPSPRTVISLMEPSLPSLMSAEALTR